VVKAATLALFPKLQEEEPHSPPCFTEVKAFLWGDVVIVTLDLWLEGLPIVVRILVKNTTHQPEAGFRALDTFLKLRVMLHLIDVVWLKLLIVVLTNASTCIDLQLAQTLYLGCAQEAFGHTPPHSSLSCSEKQDNED
jgi:hypothetical protein